MPTATIPGIHSFSHNLRRPAYTTASNLPHTWVGTMTTGGTG